MKRAEIQLIAMVAAVIVVTAAFTWWALNASYHNGYMAGLSQGWSDCNRPMRDMREGETRCPGTDLPGNVGLNLQ